MKILIAGLVAGLILSLSLSASAFGRELICNVNEGSSREIQRTNIVENGVTAMTIENRAGAMVNVRAQYDSVYISVEVEGNKFRTSNSGEAYLNVEMAGQEAMSVSCRITKDPEYCLPL